jgi:hypothetical protein
VVEESVKGAGLVQAKVHDELADIENALNGSVEQVTCEVLGKTFVFEPIDALWEAWVEQYTDEFMTLEGARRDPMAARVAACMVGIIDKSGTLVPVTDMFEMTPESDVEDSNRKLYESGNPIFREQWARTQLLNWLRSGTSKTGRSAQNGDLVYKLYRFGAAPAMRRQAEKLGTLDPFFGLSETPAQPAAQPSAPSGASGTSEATSSGKPSDS